MAWVWFLVVVLAAVLVFREVKRLTTPRRMMKRVAPAVAHIERAVHDALVTFTDATGPMRHAGDAADYGLTTSASGTPRERRAFTSTFGPRGRALLKVPFEALAALPLPLAMALRDLKRAVTTWDDAAGVEISIHVAVTRLQPLVEALAEATAGLDPAILRAARADADAEVLRAIAAVVPTNETVLH